LLSHHLVFHALGLPLFLDTLLTVTVVFYAGLVPGLAVVLINWLLWLAISGSMTPFIVVSVAEVFIVWRLMPQGGAAWPDARGRRAFAEKTSVLATLMLLYIATSVSASVLGGLVHYFYVLITPETYQEFSSPDRVFRAVFYGGEIHVLARGILSRLPVNLIDRAFVVFGGFFLALGIRRLTDKTRLRGSRMRGGR